MAKHRIVLSPADAGPIHTAPYRVGLRQPIFEEEKVDQMNKARVAEPAITERALPVGSYPK